VPARISILGAGSWGTALALLCAGNGCPTLLWGHDAVHVRHLRSASQNKRYLPGRIFPETLSVTDDLAEIGAFSDSVLVCVPSHAFKATLLKLKPHTRSGLKIAWASKGFDPENGALLHEIVASVFTPQLPAAILSGPTFAQEVAAEAPTAVTVASASADFAAQLAGLFHNSCFRTYTSSDVIGVEVGGAVKNVLAIAAGIADGLGFGANTRAALITRGLTEIMRLGVKLGGRTETFMGLSGLGDLVLTCTDNQSRNRRFGLALGRGRSKDEALSEINQEVEGILAARETWGLAEKHGIDMPITGQTYQVLYEKLPPLQAVKNLLGREQKPE
jgi:glycerol-3-phosphate dehydrogenase (NAD(P)+)